MRRCLTLTVTDIASGWTECAPVLVREQTLLAEVLADVRKVLPFALPGFDTDRPWCMTAHGLTLGLVELSPALSAGAGPPLQIHFEMDT